MKEESESSTIGDVKKVIYKRSRKYWTITIRIRKVSLKREHLNAAMFIFIVLSCSYLVAHSVYNAATYLFVSVPSTPYIPSFLTHLSSTVTSPKSIIDPVVFHGHRDKKQIALTFDADMTYGMRDYLRSGEVESYVDEKSLAILNETQTKATLFLTGLWIEAYPQLTFDLGQNPLFELGNHSYSHPAFDGTCYGLTQVLDNEKVAEVEKTQALLKEVAGVEGKVFRFPGGCYSQKDAKMIEEKKLKTIQWDVAGQDGFNDNAEAIEKNVVDNVQDGSIIVLHMNGYPNEPRTAEVLPKIISILKERGYEFVKVSDLLHPLQTASADILKPYKLN